MFFKHTINIFSSSTNNSTKPTCVVAGKCHSTDFTIFGGPKIPKDETQILQEGCLKTFCIRKYFFIAVSMKFEEKIILHGRAFLLEINQRSDLK